MICSGTSRVVRIAPERADSGIAPPLCRKTYMLPLIRPVFRGGVLTAFASEFSERYVWSLSLQVVFVEVSIMSSRGGVMASAMRRYDTSTHVWRLPDYSSPADQASGEERPGITDCLSTMFSGCCVRRVSGEIFRQPTETNTRRRFCRWRDGGIWEKFLHS